MKRLLTFLTLLTVFIGVGRATNTTVTFTFSSYYTSNTVIDGEVFYGGTSSDVPDVSLMFNKRDGGTPTQYYTTGEAVRWYGGGTLIVSSSTKTISKIVIFFTQTANSISVDNGSYSLANKTGTWTGSSSSVTFTQSGTSGHCRITAIAVTYSDGGSTVETVATPTFNPDAGTYTEEQVVTITSATTGATIHYTTNGDTPTINSPSISNGGTVTISESCTLKAIAVKADMNNSEVASAAYVINIPVTTGLPFIETFNKTGLQGTGGNDGSWGGAVATSAIVYDNEGWSVSDNWGGKQCIRLGTSSKHGSITSPTIEGLTIGNTYTLIFKAAPWGTTDNTVMSVTASGATVDGLPETAMTPQQWNNFTLTLTATSTSTTITFDSNQNRFWLDEINVNEVIVSEADYYLVGDFGGQDWPLLDEYKFTAQGDGIYVLNKVLPDMDGTENFRFKIAKVVNGQRVSPDFGGEGGEDYGLHSGWHTNIGIGNDNNHQQAFSLPDCFQANFTLNANDMTFSVDKPQLYMIGTFNNYATPNSSANGAIEMTRDTQNGGWTLTHEFTDGTEFRLYDAWHQHHGGNGAWILEELLGTWLNINNDDNRLSIFHFVLDGEYIINVKNDMSQLVATIVPESHNITCTAISDVEDGQGGYKPGGTVKAKVDGTEVTSAMAGSTVTLDITASTGYTFRSVTLNGTAIEPVEGVYSFTMPNSDATVVANFTVNHFNITLSNDDTQGTVTGLPETAYTAQTVSFSVTPEEGYTVKSVTVTPGSVAVTENEGTYSFGMPPFDVTVAVTYNAPLQPCVIPFLESWNDTEGTGGHTGGTGTGGNNTVVSDNKGWIYWKGGDTFTEFNGFGGDNCIRIGERDANGAATTPNIIVIKGYIYKMEFDAVSWNSETESILLSANGATLYSDEACTTPITSQAISNSWATYTVYVKATSDLMNITWEAADVKKRFWLDEVNIDLFSQPVQPSELTLAEIIELGDVADGKLYKISNEEGLLGVYKNGTSVWFKDKDQAVDYQNPTATTGTYEYYTVVEKDLGYNISEKDFAQNNWIEVVFPSETNFINAYVKNLTGTYSCENGNPKLTLTVAVDEENDVTKVQVGGLAYELNPYMAVNFTGNQNYTNSQGETSTFFFSKPKAQEYAQILWAVWDGEKFNMPTGEDNYYGFKGSFTVNDKFNSHGSLSNLQDGEMYNFKAIIRKSTSKAGPYEVYPTDLNPNEVITAINVINVNGKVKSVKYVNVAGMVSDVPFQGVNIVVTEYTDGSRTTSKMLRK